MSAGAFLYSKYQASDSNGGGIYRIRIQPETQALTIATVANSPPGGATNQKVSAKVSGGKRSIGMNAGKVYFRFSSTVPDGYKPDGILACPTLTPTFAALCEAGATGTYLGQSIVVIGRSSETVR